MRVLDPEDPLTIPTLQNFDRTFGERPSPVPVFDFDGVLCAPEEDAVFRLPERPGERERLSEIAASYGILAEIFDTPYLRHLVLQSILADRGVLPEPGPLLGLAREIGAARRPFFILTARSGRTAIERLFSFMQRHELLPQELFFIGRVAKGRQLAVARNTIPLPAPIVYYEDSHRHSRNSRAQDIKGMTTVHVAWRKTTLDGGERLLADALDWFSTAHVARRAA